MLGNIQIEILKRLHDSKSGMPVSELISSWKYKDGAWNSINSLQKRGFIYVKDGVAHFLKFPPEMEPEREARGFTSEELEKLEDQSRRNLVYLYKDELVRVEKGEGMPLPEGVRRSLKRLGVIKWKVLQLTEIGRNLLGEIIRSTQIACLL